MKRVYVRAWYDEFTVTVCGREITTCSLREMIALALKSVEVGVPVWRDGMTVRQVFEYCAKVLGVGIVINGQEMGINSSGY